MLDSFSYELLPRSSGSFNEETLPYQVQTRFWSQRRYHNWVYWLRRKIRPLFALRNIPAVCATFLAFLVITVPLLNPSYTLRPTHYTGTNRHSEKVFIAACIVDADLIRGAWGRAVLDLIDIIGPENSFLSIYENDSGPDTKLALQELLHKVPCKSSIVSEHLPLQQLPSVSLSPDEKRTKRITYLAEIRNRAMKPLYDASSLGNSPSHIQHTYGEILTKIDKVLFLNDVVFAAHDAADLLFATRIGPDLRTNYRAACAVDFINPVKFYDTFATRDIEGYGIGVPCFPWFSTAGDGKSRQDVIDGTDSVRVRSCWGGMVAFEARWFADTSNSLGNSVGNDFLLQPRPIRFRAEEELYWEASESCLIHRDLQAQADFANVSDTIDHPEYGKGIFLNPYIRVAYSESTFRWLELSRRFERLYTVPHRLITWLANIPSKNPRRWVDHFEWKTHIDQPPKHGTGGCYETVKVQAEAGGFCGSRQLQVLRTSRGAGQKIWENLQVPSIILKCSLDVDTSLYKYQKHS